MLGIQSSTVEEAELEVGDPVAANEAEGKVAIEWRVAVEARVGGVADCHWRRSRSPRS